MRAYNAEWHRAIGSEIRRNCIFADMVEGNEPDDWDRLFSLADNIVGADGIQPREALYNGWAGTKLFAEYTWRKLGYRGGRYAQVLEDEYSV